MTITPTAALEQKAGDELEVFAVIDGKKVFLPEDAKYIMQVQVGKLLLKTSLF